MNKRFIIIHGPTGVGKTDFVNKMSDNATVEIINCDVGQLYKPFSIGTAKPDWCNEKIPHHLFDRMTTPDNYSVTTYRKEVEQLMQEIWQRNSIPVLVGGTLFYGMGLFFPPLEQSLTTITDCVKEETATWELLQQKDPARAKLIDKNDTYRIMRALQLCHQSLQPSQLQPLYNPIEGKALIVFITRDRNELYKRINERVESMIQQGWIQEVFSLIGTKWENFLERKKLIGYTDILHFITKENSNPNAYKKMIESIQQKTRHYAKRQETFWRMLVKKMSVVAHPPEMHLCNISVEEGRKKLEIIFKHFIA